MARTYLSIKPQTPQPRPSHKNRTQTERERGIKEREVGTEHNEIKTNPAGNRGKPTDPPKRTRSPGKAEGADFGCTPKD